MSLSPFVPAVLLVILLIALALMTRFEPIVYMVGLGAIAFGMLVYVLHAKIQEAYDKQR